MVTHPLRVCVFLNMQCDRGQVETAYSSVWELVEGVWSDSGPRKSLSLYPGGLYVLD